MKDVGRALPLSRIAEASLGALALALAAITRADPDLWGHLRFGLDTLASHHLSAVDPYSFTQDRAWLNHEWLSELQMAIAYRAAGVAGLVLLKTALTFGAFWIAWRAAGRARFEARAGVMVVLVWGTIHVTSSVRPQVWTFLFVAML